MGERGGEGGGGDGRERSRGEILFLGSRYIHSLPGLGQNNISDVGSSEVGWGWGGGGAACAPLCLFRSYYFMTRSASRLISCLGGGGGASGPGRCTEPSPGGPGQNCR